jgi:RHS repeat-associated protein
MVAPSAQAQPPSAAAIGQEGGLTDTDIEFYHLDALGSVRTVTNRVGEIVTRYDFLPFGEEIPPEVGGREHVFGYGRGRALTRRYTGKERDPESGLDYFGARYFSSAQGRFTGADEWTLVLTGQRPVALPYSHVALPQSLNRYAYVTNNPLRWKDPDGHCVEIATCTLELGGAGGLIGGPPGAVVGGLIGIGVGLTLVYFGTNAIRHYHASEAQNNGPPVVEWPDGNKHPDSAQHAADAQAGGQPAEVTIDRTRAPGRRDDALRGTPTVAGKDRDHYPPAVVVEGGKGASVKPIAPSDNRGAGADLRHKIRPYPDRTVIRLQPTNVPKPTPPPTPPPGSSGY